jgi:pimeloyl-ACP methyl ester carboxylesterase
MNLAHSIRSPWLVAAAALAGAAAVVATKVRQTETRNPPKGQFVEVDGVRLHYIERGQGEPTVVLLHGLGSTSEDFEISGVLETCAMHRRVIAFDRPGYGYSTRPRRKVWTPQAQATLIRAALRRMGIARPIVVGHSWGSMVAAALALQYPQDVHAVVLVSGYYFPTFRPDAPLQGGPAIPVLGDLMSATLSPLLGRMMWPAMTRVMFYPAPVTEKFKNYPAWLSLRPGAVRAAAGESALLLPEAAVLSRRYASLQVPTFIVAGADDKYVSPQSHSVRLHSTVAGSTLKLVPGAGHMVHHVAPGEIVDTILAASRQSLAEPA